MKTILTRPRTSRVEQTFLCHSLDLSRQTAGLERVFPCQFPPARRPPGPKQGRNLAFLMIPPQIYPPSCFCPWRVSTVQDAMVVKKRFNAWRAQSRWIEACPRIRTGLELYTDGIANHWAKCSNARETISQHPGFMSSVEVLSEHS